MTMYQRRRRYRQHGDRAQQALVWAVVGALGILIGIATADWLTGYDTLAGLLREVAR